MVFVLFVDFVYLLFSVFRSWLGSRGRGVSLLFMEGASSVATARLGYDSEPIFGALVKRAVQGVCHEHN